jgi:hypothetical protein
MTSHPQGPMIARHSRHVPESCLPARGNSCKVSSDRDTRVRGIAGEVAGRDQIAQLLARLARDLDARHRLKLRQRHGFSTPRLLDGDLCPLPGTGDSVEDLGKAGAVGVGLIERAHK